MELIKKNVAGVDIEYYDIDGEVYMTDRQLSNVLGYRCRKSIQKKVEREPMLRGRDFSIQRKITASDGKRYNTRLMNSLGISMLVQKADRPKQYKEAIMTFLKVDYVVMHERVEHSLLQTIVASFSHENALREVVIGDYRADLLFPEHRIIVECDEFGHSGYCDESESNREHYLKSLGYNVIRFNPHEKDFNIGNPISEIIQAIYTKEETK